MVDKILVPFHGEGSGVEELSWGQKGVWQTIVTDGRSSTLGGVVPLPAGTTVEDIVTTLRYIVGRHQSLRTRLRFEPDGRILQHLSSSGEVPLEVLDAADDDDPAAVGQAVQVRYVTTDFDYVEEWPVRMAVIRHRGAVTHLVATYLHTTLDAEGINVLLADLAGLDLKTGQTTSPPPTGMTPMAQARLQRTPHSLRQGDASIRHLERVLRAVSPHRYPEPAEKGEPVYRMLGYRSPATLPALRVVAARHRMETTPVLLGAYAVAVARMTGISPFVTMLAVNNRFRPGFADSVSVLAQVSPCMIDVADVTVGEVMVRARQAALAAYKCAYYDPPRRVAARKAIERERGHEIDLSCFFNDRRDDRDTFTLPAEEEIRTAGEGEFHWLPDAMAAEETLYLSVDDAPDAVTFEMSADIQYFPPPRMEQVLRGLERAAVEGALDPATPTGVRADAVPV